MTDYSTWVERELIEELERRDTIRTVRCPECKSDMTDAGDVYVCDNQSCGNNIINPNV